MKKIFATRKKIFKLLPLKQKGWKQVGGASQPDLCAWDATLGNIHSLTSQRAKSRKNHQNKGVQNDVFCGHMYVDTWTSQLKLCCSNSFCSSACRLSSRCWTCCRDFIHRSFSEVQHWCWVISTDWLTVGVPLHPRAVGQSSGQDSSSSALQYYQTETGNYYTKQHHEHLSQKLNELINHQR